MVYLYNIRGFTVFTVCKYSTTVVYLYNIRGFTVFTVCKYYAAVKYVYNMDYVIQLCWCIFILFCCGWI